MVKRDIKSKKATERDVRLLIQEFKASMYCPEIAFILSNLIARRAKERDPNKFFEGKPVEEMIAEFQSWILGMDNKSAQIKAWRVVINTLGEDFAKDVIVSNTAYYINKLNKIEFMTKNFENNAWMCEFKGDKDE
jgi:hypothetical protein